jgi:membrane-anchored protein YejM (alkaline phosphatase superfamily)
MICEKFGFELLDSGDFLFMVLYLVWAFLVGVVYVQLFNYPTSLLKDFYTLCRSFFTK